MITYQGRRRFLKSGTAIERHRRSARAEGPSRGRAPNLAVTKATIHSDTDIFSLDLSCQMDLQKFESRWFVGNIHDNRRINMHVLLHISEY